MTSFSAEQVPWAEQQDYVLSVKIGAITLISTVVLWLLLLLVLKILIMGEKDKKTQARKSTKLTRKVKGELDALVKKLEREWELKGADLFAPLPSTEDCAICFVPLSRLTFAWYLCPTITTKQVTRLVAAKELPAGRAYNPLTRLVRSAVNQSRSAWMMCILRSCKQDVCKMITMRLHSWASCTGRVY